MFPLYGSSDGGTGNLYCKLSGDWNGVCKVLKTFSFSNTNLGESLVLRDLGLGDDADLLVLDQDGVQLRALVVVRQHGVRQLREMAHFIFVHVQQSEIKSCYMKNVSFSHVKGGMSLNSVPFMISFKMILTPLCLIHFFLQLINLLQFSLPTILSGHLIFPPSPDVSADVELLLREVLLTQHVIELIHGRVDNVLLLSEKIIFCKQ